MNCKDTNEIIKSVCVAVATQPGNCMKRLSSLMLIRESGNSNIKTIQVILSNAQPKMTPFYFHITSSFDIL